MSVQELTINLPNNPRLRGMNHHHDRGTIPSTVNTIMISDLKSQGNTQEAERASSIPAILIPDLRLSKVQQGVHIKNRTLQPPPSVQELTINLPNNPRLRGMSHHSGLSLLNIVFT